MSDLKTSDFSYHLPDEFIAQQPVTPRDASRLMILKGEDHTIEHAHFYDLGRYLTGDDVLVINRTRVLQARLHGWKKATGGKVEVLLLRKISERIWEALVGGRGLRAGRRITIPGGPEAEVLRELEGGLRVIRFEHAVEPYLDEIGQPPLPPYIHRRLENTERYQTVYGDRLGSAAAPTAGLHFTPRLIEELRGQGVQFAEVTLHVGLDTFVPVRVEDPQDHPIHSEWCTVSEESAKKINHTHRRGGKVIAVGTTSVRTLETAAQLAGEGEIVRPYQGDTDLFILPGYDFQAVDAMITNFHLPESTLLMLVCAFAGRERILQAYELAMEEGYRFYSFGDAMYLEP